MIHIDLNKKDPHRINQAKDKTARLKNSQSDTVVVAGGAAIFVLVLLLISRLIFRDYLGWEQTFLTGDALVQYVHVIKMFLRHLLNGESMVYSFELGLGMPTCALYAYYALSPFNIIYLFVKDIDLATFFVVIGKLMTAAAMFGMMLHKMVKPERTVSVILAGFYALCGFSTCFFYGLLFLDMLYLMPVVLLAIKHMICTGEWRILSIVYAVCFAMQFYCGYIIGFFSAVAFICMVWYYSDKDKTKWIGLVKKYTISVLTAVLLSAPVTVPAAAELFSHLDKEAVKNADLSLTFWDFLAAFYPGHAGDAYNPVPRVYSGVLPLVLTGVFFCDKTVEKKKKIVLALPGLFLLLCTFSPMMYLLSHALDVPDGYCYRFSWLYSFWLLYVAAIESRSVRSEVNGGIVLFFCTICGIGYFVLFAGRNLIPLKSETTFSLYTGLLCVVLLLMYAICIQNYYKGTIWKKLLVGLCGLELIYNIGCMKKLCATDINDREYYHIWQQQAEGALSFIAKQEQDDPWTFYRVHNLNCLTDNISMLYGFHGLGYFCSIENDKVRSTLQDLGYATSGRLVSDYGSTAFTRMIFAQKYSLECGFWLGTQRGYYSVKKNENILPLGIMVSEDFIDCELATSNAFINQNIMAEAMLGEPGIVPWKLYEGGMEIETEGMIIEPSEKGLRICLEDEGKMGSAVCLFENGKEERLFAYVPLWGMSGNAGDSIRVFSALDIGGMTEYSKLTKPHIIPLENGGESRPTLYFQMIPDEMRENGFETICAAYEDGESIEQIYQKLAGGGWNPAEFGNDVIEGHVFVDGTRKLLFTSIPYEKNWEAYVDGNRTETIAVLDDAFLAFRVPEGTHEIRMEYKNKTILPAAMLFICGCLICLISGEPHIGNQSRQKEK